MSSSNQSNEVSAGNGLSGGPLEFFKVYYLFIIIVGFFGNLFCTYYWSRKTQIKQFASKIFFAISVCDISLTVLDTLLYDLLNLYNIQWSLHLAMCIVHSMAYYIFRSMSMFLLEIITLERLVGVVFPTKVKLICTNKIKLALIVCSVFFSILQGALFVPLLVLYPNGRCAAEGDRNLATIRFAITMFLEVQAFITLIVANSYMFWKLRKRSLGQDQMLNSMVTTLKMIIALSSLFLITNTPVYLIICLTLDFKWFVSVFSYETYLIFFNFVKAFNQTNHSVNVIFYAATNKKFREKLLTIIGYRKLVEIFPVLNRVGADSNATATVFENAGTK